MIVSLALAAAVAVGIGLVHSILGERLIVGPILRGASNMPVLQNRLARRVVRFAWHLTTLAWFGFAAILVLFSLSNGTPEKSAILSVIAAVFLISGIVTLTISRGRHIAWPFFLGVAGLVASQI